MEGHRASEWHSWDSSLRPHDLKALNYLLSSLFARPRKQMGMWGDSS